MPTVPRPRLRSQAGQGTVEYIALILLLAGIFAAVVAFNGDAAGEKLSKTITSQIDRAVDEVVGGREDKK